MVALRPRSFLWKGVLRYIQCSGKSCHVHHFSYVDYCFWYCPENSAVLSNYDVPRCQLSPLTDVPRPPDAHTHTNSTWWRSLAQTGSWGWRRCVARYLVGRNGSSDQSRAFMEEKKGGWRYCGGVRSCGAVPDRSAPGRSWGSHLNLSSKRLKPGASGALEWHSDGR